jgi:hypothetical protein
MATTTTDPFKETISAHLQEVAKNDKLFAETLKKPNKSIDSCINYIYSEVRKTKRCGWNDDEIFNMAIHYYDEDSIEEVSKIQRPQVSHTPEKPKTSSKMEEYKKVINEAVKKPEPKAKITKKEPTKVFVQTSLFD